MKYNYYSIIKICIILVISSCYQKNHTENNNLEEKDSNKIKKFVEENDSIIELNFNSITLNNNSNIIINAKSYKEISIIIKNNTPHLMEIEIPNGLMLNNLIDKQQDLMLLESRNLNVLKNNTDTIKIMSACINPGLSMPNSNKWEIFNKIPEQLLVIKDIPDFFIKIDEKLKLIDKFRKNKIYSTVEQQQNLKQMVIWILLDTDESTMIDFMNQYVYKDKQKARNFVKEYYDPANEIIDVYRNYKTTGKIDLSKLKERSKNIKRNISNKFKSIIK